MKLTTVSEYLKYGAFVWYKIRFSDWEILSSIHIWHMVWRSRTRAGPLYLRCDRYYLLRNSSFYNSLSVDKKSIQLQDLSLFIVVSWLLVLRTIYQDIVPINTTVISIKIEIEKGQSSHHLRCVDKSEDTILAVIESINRNLKSSFGVILHRTVAQTGNGPAYFDLKL